MRANYNSAGLVIEEVTPKELRLMREHSGLPLPVTLSCDGRRYYATAPFGTDVTLIYLATDDELQLSFTGKGF